MEGVTILNTTIGHATSMGLIIFSIVCGFILSGVCIYGLICSIECKDIGSTISNVIYTAITLTLCAVGIIKAATYNLPENITIRHEALISEDTRLKEFNEKYKIVEINGEVYTIEEIEVEK